MTAATEFGWGEVVVILGGILALCFLAVILLVRSQRSHTLRVGFFIERDVPAELADDDEQPTAEHPTLQ